MISWRRARHRRPERETVGIVLTGIIVSRDGRRADDGRCGRESQEMKASGRDGSPFAVIRLLKREEHAH
jgi:hypothetical protein